MSGKGPIYTFANSITGVDAYESFLHQPFSKAMMYLLLVSLIFSGIVNIKTAWEINSGVNELVYYFASDFPEFELKDGVLAVDAEMPIILDDTEEMFYAIDTSGVMDKSVLDNYREGIFISEHEFVQKTGFETRSYQFSSLEGFRVTKGDVQRWLPLLKWINVFVFVFGFFFYVLGKLFSAFLLSLGGLLIEVIIKHKIGFGNLYKLSIYALTLPMLIKLLQSLTGVVIPQFWVFYYGIAFFYLWKALELLRNANAAETHIR